MPEHSEQIGDLIVAGTDLLMVFQRKEQLPRKFVTQDRYDLEEFEKNLQDYMESIGDRGRVFLAEWRNSPIVILGDEKKINTRELKRCIQLMVKFRDELTANL